MQASEKIKQYFQIMLNSIQLVKQLSDELDGLYKASIHMDFEATNASNERVNQLTVQIAQLHEQRQKIAKEFGCTSEKFSFELAQKLPEKLQQQLQGLSEQLKTIMDDCQDKLEAHSEQLQLQKYIVSEAVESLNLTVSA